VADLQQWLGEAGLERAAFRTNGWGFTGGRWADRCWRAPIEARAHAVSETEKALHIARRIPAAVLVAHLGIPRTQTGPGDSRAAARASRNCCGSPNRSACASRSR
jgi:sugar phosphate isomerase/epimerase